ncbi:MAG: hypothetical protein HYR94_06650 [Chloroflexi bacterium]|nr:hypothetical protein [Chloroflexota bacterium]
MVACSVKSESLKRVTPFPNSMGRDRRLLLYAGIRSSDCYVSLDNVAWIPSLLGLPLNQRGQVLLDDASTIASLIVSPSHLLDGITMSGSPYSAFSSRFCLLRTSRQAGDEAVTRTTAGVGLDDTREYQHTNIELELSKNKGVLCRPSPGHKLVSGERIAPSACSRIATAAILCDVKVACYFF